MVYCKLLKTLKHKLHFLFQSDDEKPLNIDEDNDRLKDYINEISSTDVSNQLHKECQQILSKQNLDLSNLDLNQLSLITLYSLHNQHLTDEAKQLYNETGLRALQQEYELINEEKNDLIEQLNSLQKHSNELLEHERLHSKQIVKDLIEKYEIERGQLQMNLFNLNEENEKLQQQLNNQNENLTDNQYNQLKLDFDQLMNENELLKDYNAQIYQEKLQEHGKRFSSAIRGVPRWKLWGGGVDDF